MFHYYFWEAPQRYRNTHICLCAYRYTHSFISMCFCMWMNILLVYIIHISMCSFSCSLHILSDWCDDSSHIIKASYLFSHSTLPSTTFSILYNITCIVYTYTHSECVHTYSCGFYSCVCIHTDILVYIHAHRLGMCRKCVCRNSHTTQHTYAHKWWLIFGDILSLPIKTVIPLPFIHEDDCHKSDQPSCALG